MEMINVDLGDGEGIKQMDTSQLEGPVESVYENDHEKTVATEYRLDGKLVHRSVHVTLKEGLGIEGILGGIG